MFDIDVASLVQAVGGSALKSLPSEATDLCFGFVRETFVEDHKVQGEQVEILVDISNATFFEEGMEFYVEVRTSLWKHVKVIDVKLDPPLYCILTCETLKLEVW